MSNEIEDLRNDYQKIEAPDHLATRIRAHTKDERRGARNWLPAAATFAVAAAIFAVTPIMMNHQPATVAQPRTPSLSMLSGVSRSKPAAAVPSLNRLRTLRTPRMPRKPVATPPKPQSYFDIQNDDKEEKHHA